MCWLSFQLTIHPSTNGMQFGFPQPFSDPKYQILLCLLSAYCGKFGVTPLESIGLPWIYGAVNEIRIGSKYIPLMSQILAM